ncbi:MAG TPA: hypothetical protein DET40_02970, partial [Lentisphaeria bacterium]|nr:hypothetical protein [Lentisphaeria bacterium]
MTKRIQWKSVLAVIAALVVTPGTISTVLADASGRSGYSGNPATRSGATCSSCHSGGPATTVTLSGPTSVAPNSTNAYTVTVTSAGQTGGGFDVSTTAGTLAAGTGSKLSAAEVIQSAQKTMTAGSVSWQFNWTAPASGTATLYASGLSTDRDGNDGGDMTAKTTRVITVASATNAAPVARPAGPYTGTAGVAVSLSGATSTDSDGTIASYAWNFGDSTTGTGVSPTHVYAATGTYTVTLIVTDNLGATGTATTTANIALAANVLPVARPAGPYTGTAGQAVSLSGAASTDSDGTIASYAWNFGDSTTGTGATTTHAYAAAGTYTVSLTVTDNRGGTNTATTTATIAQAANVLPVARAGGPYTGTPGQAVSLSGATSTDSDGTIASYAWNFGDSTTGTGVTTTHSYAAAGTYTVSLTVTDNRGGTNTASTTANITQTANVLPVARPAGPYTGAPGVTVSFSGATSSDSDGTIASYAWNFGDSTTGTGATATHAYAAAGTYTVSLTVTDNRGGTNTASTTANISQAANVLPVARPAGPYTGAPGVAVSFSGATSSDSDGTIASYAWNFGDSTTGTGATATHAYAAAGTYTVSLTVTDNRGGTNTATTTATISASSVNAPPVAILAGPYTGTVGQAVSFSGAASTDSDGTISRYAWNFGDSRTGTGVSTTHTYSAARTYTVTLTVTDNRGARSTTSASCVIATQPPSLNRAPTVKTNSVNGINITYATGNGEITDLGSSNPTAYGMVWNKTGTPKIGDRISKYTNKGTVKKTVSFTSLMRNLSPNTKYYVRAYATNKYGTRYGAEVTFTTMKKSGEHGDDDDDDDGDDD